MNSKLDELIGKEIHGCRFLGTRLNLNPTTFSLCHEAQVGDRVLGKIEDLSPETYYEALYQLVMDNMSADAPCRKCTKGEKYCYSFQPLTFVTINTSTYCNSSCIYCIGHFGKEGKGYNPIPFLQMFEEEKLFSSECFFDWGGGEPTLNPYFEECVEWLYNHNYYQRINTNAILYSEATAKALKKGKACLRMSIDSGTRECFYRMKGHEGYSDVWDNIKRYCEQNSGDVFVKYNVCNYNSDTEELEAFLHQCRMCGVKNILVDGEINSYQPKKNAGPFYFTNKEFAAAHMLEKMAKEKGFSVKTSAYAFSVRAEYDEAGNLCLPKTYYDNLDKDIVSNDIKVETYPNIAYMVKEFKEIDMPIAIWGMGRYGKLCYEILEREGLKVSFLIDQSIEKQKEQFGETKIISPEEFFEMRIPARVILTGNRTDMWKSMLKRANEEKYNCGKLVYMHNIFYSAYFE